MSKRLIVALFLCVGALTACSHAGRTGSAAGGVAQALTTNDVQRIEPAQAKRLQDQGAAVLYDARSSHAYLAGHAAGAVSLPESEVDARCGELPTGTTLIFY